MQSTENQNQARESRVRRDGFEPVVVQVVQDLQEHTHAQSIPQVRGDQQVDNTGFHRTEVRITPTQLNGAVHEQDRALHANMKNLKKHMKVQMIPVTSSHACRQQKDTRKSAHKHTIWGSVAFRIRSPIFSILRQYCRGSCKSEPLITILGKSNKWTSMGSSSPRLSTMICRGCSSTGRDRINAATCSRKNGTHVKSRA